MKVDLKRRDFLRLSGGFVLAAGLPFKSGCGGDGGGPAPGVYGFPQGLASGDPRETSVVLWTRVQLVTGATTDPIDMTVQVATESTFDNVVVEQMVQATTASDHTVRVLITGLTAGTQYHYRFVVQGDSIAGRTRTAPLASADVPVNLAWVSCQDYEAGTYGAYRQLLADDEAAPSADKVQFVVHLGDFIYETSGADFQRALDEDFEFFDLRGIEAFPDGPKHATTLADDRHLYKKFLLDPDLQEARARCDLRAGWRHDGESRRQHPRRDGPEHGQFHSQAGHHRVFARQRCRQRPRHDHRHELHRRNLGEVERVLGGFHFRQR